MTKAKPPGSGTGKNGGIFQEVGDRGGKKDNYCAVPDNSRLPPTTESGHKWMPIKTTPDSKR